MIIFGHKFIKTEPFYLIKRVEDIKKTPPNSIVVFDFSEKNLELIEHCNKSGISFAVICDRIKDVLFANALNANFIICDKVVSPKAQKLAENYMFDAKILLYSSDEADIEWASEHEIDGIIFEEGIDYGSC